jgi:hypothetical protein
MFPSLRVTYDFEATRYQCLGLFYGSILYIDGMEYIEVDVD